MKTNATASCLCPACEQHSLVDAIGTKGTVRLLACRTCGLVFADRELWKNPYENEDYYRVINDDPQPSASSGRTHRDRLEFVRRWIKTGALLEFGGGRGETALAASDSGFDVTLIDDSRNAIRWGAENHPQIRWIQAASIPADLPSSSFDVVTAFHVLEHVLEPRDMFRQFARVLKPGGFLCLEVPNWASHERKLRGLNWTYVLDHHVNQFDKSTLCYMASAEQFRFSGCEYRRTFAINEDQPWKEPLKRVLCWLGFGNILRAIWQKTYCT